MNIIHGGKSLRDGRGGARNEGNCGNWGTRKRHADKNQHTAHVEVQYFARPMIEQG